ncbi:MAG: hypothetical protein RR573_07225, partial [Oscillospiraceae bacterium]
FKRKICASGHNRSQKVMFIAAEIYDKLDEILLCGIDPQSEFIPSKFNSYDGLCSSDSTAVSMPNIVVIKDYETAVQGKYDVVQGSVIDSDYIVLNDIEKALEIIPFDGAGLVNVAFAQKWAKELGLHYIPASFQFRCLAGIKGNLFTFDTDKFSSLYGTKIIDLWGKEWDCKTDKIDVIITESQFKFHSLYNSFDEWRTAFKKILYGYKRTFNISEYAAQPNELKHNALMCYQPLQTLSLSEEEIKTLCQCTINKVKKIHTDVGEFLRYRNIREFDDDNEKVKEWNFTPPYYKALKHNHSLFNDEYVKGKIKRDVKTIVRKCCVGKILVDGNYQTLGCDLYGLAQFAFGLEVTGLLGKDEIYSNYWNGKNVTEVDLLRSPHIANEHCVVRLVNGSEIQKWFKYQTVNIITGFYDTNVMKLNSADFDGDHVLTLHNGIIVDAAKRNISNTIDFNNVDVKQDIKKCKVSDISQLIETDKIGFENDIGTVINQISILWSLPQSQEIQDYIKIMSVIGSLTIDFVKTGQKANIPKNIKSLIAENHYHKPYFMRYGKLSTMRQDDMAKRETARLETQSHNKNKPQSPEKYDNRKCTMNNLCHHMEKELLQLKVEYMAEPFDCSTLIHSDINIYNETYKQLKAKLLKVHKNFIEICTRYSKMAEIEQSDFGQRQYQRFYSYCKVEFQNIYFNLNKTVDMDKLLDYICFMFYYDADIMANCPNKSVLWNVFPDELICRCKGLKNTRVINTLKLNERKVKAQQQVIKLREDSRIVGLPFIDELPSVIFTKGDKKRLKQLVKDVDARNLLFVLIMLDRKIRLKCEIEPIKKYDGVMVVASGRNQINRTQICKLSGISDRHIDEVINHLLKLDLLTIDSKNVLKQKYYVHFDGAGGEECCVIKSINLLTKAIKDDYRYFEKDIEKTDLKTA